MMLNRKVIPLAALLTACAGAPVGASPQGNGGGPLDRVNLYEVPVAAVRQAQEAGFIEVTGTASVDVEPDLAQVTFAVETRMAGADDAAAANADAMEGILAALRGSALQGLTIETFGYSLRPEYSFPGGDRSGPRRIDGYTVVNSVRASTEDLEAVGALIDLGIQSGANRVSSISFSASETDAAETEALAEAVADARRQAAAIATGLGRELGPALEARGGGQAPGPRVQYRMMEAAAARATTPIEAGTQVVTAAVTIRFAIGSGESLR